MPKVSICLPVYNGERFLKQAIDSILRQTFNDFELIILDNNSTDDTENIYKKYIDKRIRIIRHKKNIGSGANWDFGVRISKGQYIAIYHADDVYEKNILEKEVTVLEKHKEVSCVFTNYTNIDAQGKKLQDTTLPKHLVDKPITYEQVLLYLASTFRSPFVSPTCIARKSTYKKTPSYSNSTYTQAADVNVYLHLTKHGSAFLLNERLLRYRHSDEQASIRYSTTYVKPNQLFRVLDGHLKNIELPHDVLNTYEAYREWDYTVRAINILAKKRVTKADEKKARSYLRKSLTMRRVCRFHKEVVLFTITFCMLVLSHIGLGRWGARRINATRMRRHTS